MAAAAYRLKGLLRSKDAGPLPPSLLEWARQQLPLAVQEGVGAVVLQVGGFESERDANEIIELHLSTHQRRRHAVSCDDMAAASSSQPQTHTH